MKLSIGALKQETGLSEEVKISYPMADTEFRNEKLTFLGPVLFSGRIKNDGGDFAAAGQVVCDIEATCNRCLDPAKIHLDFLTEIYYSYNAEEKNEKTDEEYLPVDNDEIDLGEGLEREIYIHMPNQILCKEDCKGLCPVCGQNLNHGECRCDNLENTMNPKFQKLKDLKLK